jgi:hypothetical protein
VLKLSFLGKKMRSFTKKIIFKNLKNKKKQIWQPYIIIIIFNKDVFFFFSFISNQYFLGKNIANFSRLKQGKNPWLEIERKRKRKSFSKK